MSSSSAFTPPPSYSRDKSDVYKQSLTYKDYVRTLCARNPSLLTLHSFLANPKARAYGCHVTALDFHHGTATPSVRLIPDIDCLSYELGEPPGSLAKEKGRNTNQSLHGRVLIVEDLTVQVIELLGSALDLDPLFLATHLHTVHRTGMRHQTPDDATLPSRFHGRDFVNVSYHQPLTSNVAYPLGGKFALDAAIDRKLVFLRATSIGLAQHRVSVIKLRRDPGFWLALMLVDPPIGDTYYHSEYKDDPQHKVTLDVNPYLGTYENFMDLPRFSESWDQDQTGINLRQSMANDLIGYWKKSLAAEWVKYIAVMQHCIKMYEYEGSQLDLEKFNMDLRELQGWRRRSMISQQKIRAVIRHLRTQPSLNPEHVSCIDKVLQDYTVIESDIEDAGRRLENMLPVVTSLVQIIDARQSFAETANISRLTVLALIFVPLSYISSLFSMNSENMPGSSGFWVYFAVAIPVTVIVFLVARPPTVRGVQQMFAWVRGCFKRKPRPTALSVDAKSEIDIKKEDWVRVRSKTMRM
ncbi:hypothetical protein C7974DRAFT_386384 [Boeremia exigua]|uniref:uncharacterized protein n=1 Tax=Boeremia exigua TaxID=749465 RepID=UPI001E8D56C2|nr:uncharacterized protein C7974DRAFT_386384 [Boeremia exigua]KAH6642910.1 hypothetical protein C7974DRAFT_386384 [Boeremia exigua]